MGWDRKRRGPGTGYYYRTVRVPGKPHPVKTYFGRREAGHDAAADDEARRKDAKAARDLVRAEANPTPDADELADALAEWAAVLAGLWLVAAGYKYHRGEWRRVRDGQVNE